MSICILGCGYVGLQLALEFQKKLQVYCVDINETRIQEYKNGIDNTGIVEELKAKSIFSQIVFESDINRLPTSTGIDTYIVCVPTPIDKNKKPDIKALKSATKSIKNRLKKNDLVVFESTVAPFTTEKVCIPILEESNLKCGEDFFVGYSPERLKPSLKNSVKLTDTVKLVSGNDYNSFNRTFALYNLILPHKKLFSCNIVTAETAKLLENIKRDVNIALMNQFKLICDKKGIDFDNVLKAASTKEEFNHASYSYGMVGGHCIGIDPYYMIDFYKDLNIPPEKDLIQTARDINETVPLQVADLFINILYTKKRI